MGIFTALFGFVGVVLGLIMWGLYSIGVFSGEAEATGWWLICLFIALPVTFLVARKW